jgi:hypothetical protein
LSHRIWHSSEPTGTIIGTKNAAADWLVVSPVAIIVEKIKVLNLKKQKNEIFNNYRDRTYHQPISRCLFRGNPGSSWFPRMSNAL